VHIIRIRNFRCRSHSGGKFLSSSCSFRPDGKCYNASTFILGLRIAILSPGCLSTLIPQH